MKESLKTLFEFCGFEIRRISKVERYDEDGFVTAHNHDFMKDPKFRKAYQRGVRASGEDYQFHWRVHVALWVAAAAGRLDGDFVECGVNRGFISSAIMDYLHWNSMKKKFYLLDTFTGLDERLITEEERRTGALSRNKDMLDSEFYVRGVESVRSNFSEWKNVRIIIGSVPDTLPQIKSPKISYLHLDMNCSPPEVAAADFLWNRMVSGGFILLDDYAYYGYALSKAGMDDFAARENVSVLSLPTGQGLIVKP